MTYNPHTQTSPYLCLLNGMSILSGLFVVDVCLTISGTLGCEVQTITLSLSKNSQDSTFIRV